LSEGQYARVLQLPVIRQEQDVKAGAEKALMPAADLEVTVTTINICVIKADPAAGAEKMERQPAPEARNCGDS
jgi:hypothetical protein